jgi:GNAT superfamily N-acetyltransferase
MVSIRLAGPADEKARDELLRERLPTTDLDARLRWIYRGNPQGPAHSWIAYDDESGDPAGMTTFFARKLWADGEVVDGALGGDMYVRPRFRRRGIGQELFVVARRDMLRLGVRLMFGTPMRPNVHALLSSGSTVPEGSVVRYGRILASSATRLAFLPRPVGRLLDPLLAPRMPRGLHLEALTGADPRPLKFVDELWAATRGELGVATVRDAAFYRWRFVDAPSKKQRPMLILDGNRPLAACALETVKDKLRIVDLLAPAADWPRAIAAIAASATGETGLEIRLATRDAARRALWRAGMVRREDSPMSMLTPEEAPNPGLHDADRWFLTWADTDIDHW